MKRFGAAAAALSVAAAGCATTGASLDKARAALETSRDMLELVDERFTPVFLQTMRTADAAYPKDDAAYHAAIAAQEELFRRIENARIEHTLLTIAYTRWAQRGEFIAWQRRLPSLIKSLEVVRASAIDPLVQEAVRTAITALQPRDDPIPRWRR